ncbi:MAG: PQQ-binding-like beta-propeller repeat protein [Verrucomicrobiales bacterium]|nr:PQQ-binding-like beta-propeller repeat protein [Verrucomicrobiales bacterium]
MKSPLKTGCLALVCLFGPATFWIIRRQEMTYLNWFLALAVIVWALLFGAWYLVFGRAKTSRRFLNVFATLGGIVLIGFILSKTLKYEGSASGSSYPRFSWVWNAEKNDSGTTAELVQTELTGEDLRLLKAQGDSPEFLGPNRDGTFTQLTFNPDWNTEPPELLWRRPVGKAWSGFAVKGRMAVTQEQAGDAERVLCLDLFTGDAIWHHDNPETRLLLVKEENQGAAMGGDGPRSTPVIHRNHVYALGATGILNCLDLTGGDEKWTRNVITEFKGEVQKWGSANAPLVIESESILVVPGSDEPGATLVAFDLETGETRWTYQGNGASYSSPRLLTVAGVEMIISVNRHDVTGNLPESGEVLWTYPWPGSYPKVGQAVAAGENRLLFTASYGAGSPLIEVTPEQDGSWEVREIWKSTRLKTKFSSAFVVDGFAYGIDEGRLASIDLETGDKAWKNQKVGFGQQLLFGDTLLIQTERGPVITGPVGPDGFTELSRLEALDSMTWNVPTVAGRILLVRNDQEAACYLLPALK